MLAINELWASDFFEGYIMKEGDKHPCLSPSSLFNKSMNYSPLIAATPGRTLPSIASNKAPPPVEM